MHTTADNLDQDVLPVVTCLLKVLNVSLCLHSNMFRMTPMIMEEKNRIIAKYKILFKKCSRPACFAFQNRPFH